jgi:hypothetical protein
MKDMKLSMVSAQLGLLERQRVRREAAEHVTAQSRESEA